MTIALFIRTPESSNHLCTVNGLKNRWCQICKQNGRGHWNHKGIFEHPVNKGSLYMFANADVMTWLFIEKVPSVRWISVDGGKFGTYLSIRLNRRYLTPILKTAPSWLNDDETIKVFRKTAACSMPQQAQTYLLIVAASHPRSYVHHCF